MQQVPLTIGIAGGTCAGKSRLAGALCAHYGDALLLAMDSFYREQPRALIAAGQADFDTPDALDLAAMADALAMLRAGLPAEIPLYDRAGSSVMGRQTVSPRGVLVVEGLYVLDFPPIREQLDLAVFIAVEPDVQRTRRQVRDTIEYGRPEERLLHDLARAHADQARHVAPSRAFAQLVLSGTAGLEEQMAACLGELKDRA